MNCTRVSVHGGHSGEFCNHAHDSLEEIVCAYIEQGFRWVGITEHIPPLNDTFLYPEEREAGLTAESMLKRFSGYFEEIRRLQNKYASQIELFAAMETEAWSGYEAHVKNLITRFSPQYIVGSVHHVEDIPFDYSQQEYDRAVTCCGGLEALYCRYFDLQYAMIERLRPQVVGHFDLIRLYDPFYRDHLRAGAIWRRIERNLGLVKKLDLILDYNFRSLVKGASEPYISHDILLLVKEMGIRVAPGDDSHGRALIGQHVDDAMESLVVAGFMTHWPKPV